MRRTCSSISTTTRPMSQRVVPFRSSRSFRAWGCALTSNRACRAALLGAVLVAGGCELEKVAIPATESRVSLHGVLSASAPTQVVLLERTRNGTVRMFAPPFDLADPIVSDEGVAESRAIVRLTTPDGQTLVAVEDNVFRADRKGEGIYGVTLTG